MNCLVRAHHAGLFSNLNKVLTAMDIYEHTSVDWTGSIYSPELDLFPRLFERLPPPTVPFTVVTDYPDEWLTGLRAAQLYTNNGRWRTRCHELWNRLTVRPWIKALATSFVKEHFAKSTVVTVLVRADTHSGEQVSGKSQPLEAYAVAIENELRDGTKVFVMCQDETSIAWLSSRFPVVAHPSTKRVPHRDQDRHLTEVQTHEDAAMVLEEALIAAETDTLIHPVSNIATALYYINPSIKGIYLP